MKNHYEALGVSRNASQKEIKAAYRKLAVELHPDKTKGDKTKEDRFKEITNAYDILKDKDKRKQYDDELKYGSSHNFRGFSGRSSNMNFNEAFREQFFQHFRTNKSPSINLSPDIELTLKIQLKNALKGGNAPIKFTRRNVCESCGGTKRNKCFSCNGQGLINGGICRSCMGLGYTGTCETCRGGGFISEYVETKIKIPASTKSGSKMRLRGYGNKVKKGEVYLNGDVIVKIDYPLNTTYMDGDRKIELACLNENIYGSFSVNIEEILTQKTIKLNFLDLKTFNIELSLEKSDYKFEGEGFNNGDVILNPNISINEKEFTEEDKKKLQEAKQIFLDLYNDK